MILRSAILILLYIISASVAQAQISDTWYFYENFQVDFDGSGYTVSEQKNGKVKWTEDVGIVKDTAGNILFYTDGDVVWDRNHEIMPNGRISSRRGLHLFEIIPTENEKYLILTEQRSYKPPVIFAYGTRYYHIVYSEVDMSLRGGLGDVTDREVWLYDSLASFFQVIPQKCDEGYWIVCHDHDSDLFLTYSYSDGVFSEEPIVSKIGEKRDYSWVYNNSFQVSADGELIAAHYFETSEDESIRSQIMLYRFDPNLGHISDELLIPFVDPIAYIAFSPDGSKIYASTYKRSRDTSDRALKLIQIDVSQYDSTSISSSMTTISETYGGSLTQSNHHTMYACRRYQPYISAINRPNEAGVACDFVEEAIQLPKDITYGGFPHPVVQNPYTPKSKVDLSDSIICPDDLLTLDLSAHDSLRWDDGSSESIRELSREGLYPIEIYDDGCVQYDTLEIIHDAPPQQLLSDTLLCEQDTLQIDLSSDYVYIWDDSLMSTSHRVTSPTSATYLETISDRGCTRVDTLMIDWRSASSPYLGSDASICPGETLTLMTETSHERYLWSTGAESSLITVSDIGQYYLTTTDEYGCIASDTIYVDRSEDCECHIYIPTGLSPSSSRGNDRWSPSISCPITAYQVQVYDRWGALMYTSNSPSESWDGTRDGAPCLSGVYTYTLTYQKVLSNRTYHETGTVTLVR